MSKTGQALFQMQEDALELSREDFVKKYGKVNEDLYDRIWQDYWDDKEPDPEND